MTRPSRPLNSADATTVFGARSVDPRPNEDWMIDGCKDPSPKKRPQPERWESPMKHRMYVGVYVDPTPAQDRISTPSIDKEEADAHWLTRGRRLHRDRFPSIAALIIVGILATSLGIALLIHFGEADAILRAISK